MCGPWSQNEVIKNRENPLGFPSKVLSRLDGFEFCTVNVLAHLSQRLKVRYCDHSSSGVRNATVYRRP